MELFIQYHLFHMTKEAGQVNWIKSNRLMTGSLLAFTRHDCSIFVFAHIYNYKNSNKA